MRLDLVITGFVFIPAAGFSLLSGGKPERLAGVALVLWLGLDQLYHLLGYPAEFRHADLVHVVLDTAVFILLLSLAIFANRFWPIVAASVQSVVILGHISMLMSSGMQRAYWVMTQIPPLFVALAILFGALAHIARVRRIGEYPDWRPAVTH